MDLNGKVVIITGAARGIGKAFAKGLLEKGGKVCLCDINENLGNTTYKQLSTEYGKDNVIFVKCDVTNKDDLQSVFEITKTKFHGIDVVINNAGIINEDDWETCVDVNLKGVIRGTMLAADALRTDKGGRGGTVVNISSMTVLRPVWFVPVYVATKHGIYSLTKSFAEIPNLKENGVRCVCICPGVVETDIVTTTLRQRITDGVGEVRFTSIDAIVQGLFKVLGDTDNNGSALMINENDPANNLVYK